MADLTKKNRSTNTRLVGADPITGAETEWVTVTDNNDLEVVDRLDHGGEDTVKTITTTASQIFVGVSERAERAVLILQGDGRWEWGFSNTTQSFRAFRNQYIYIDVGPNTQVWAKATTGTVDLSIGEAS